MTGCGFIAINAGYDRYDALVFAPMPRVAVTRITQVSGVLFCRKRIRQRKLSGMRNAERS